MRKDMWKFVFLLAKNFFCECFNKIKQFMFNPVDGVSSILFPTLAEQERRAIESYLMPPIIPSA